MNQLPYLKLIYIFFLHTSIYFVFYFSPLLIGEQVIQICWYHFWKSILMHVKIFLILIIFSKSLITKSTANGVENK